MPASDTSPAIIRRLGVGFQFILAGGELTVRHQPQIRSVSEEMEGAGEGIGRPVLEGEIGVAGRRRRPPRLPEPRRNPIEADGVYV